MGRTDGGFNGESLAQWTPETSEKFCRMNCVTKLIWRSESYCVCVGDADTLLLVYSFFFFFFHYLTELCTRFSSVETKLQPSIEWSQFAFQHSFKNLTYCQKYSSSKFHRAASQQMLWWQDDISQTGVMLKHCSEARRRRPRCSERSTLRLQHRHGLFS